jgi:predicted metal-dependent phosphoesterase TrpH
MLIWRILMKSADMHIHSTESDGVLTPEEIVEWGKKKNLFAISVTDHDCISGVERAEECASRLGIEVIPGIELSTEYCGAEVHILGYFIDYKSAELESFLSKLQLSRLQRLEKMIKKLYTMGYDVSTNEIVEVSKETKSLGRPHIARLLVEKGYCRDISDAFQRFLSKGRPAYVERYKLSPFEAVELVMRCSGVPCLAHPALIPNLDTVSLVKKLSYWGLKGIEVYHTAHTHEDIEYLSKLAAEQKLIPTGGTDFHGEYENNEPIIGRVSVAYEYVEKLRLLSNSKPNS